MKSKKIILDTNLWISYLITKNYKQLDRLIDNKEVTLIFSQELIEEFIEVTSRPKFEKYFSFSDIKELLSKFDTYGKLIKVTSRVEKCRDFKDNFLLNLAIDSKSDYLLTGDIDLLELKRVNKTRIITFKELISILD